MKRGFLIALEGVDGSGKTTQARLLAAALKDRGLKATLTREPTDGRQGEKLRRYLAGPARHLSAAAELALFTADRRDHVRQVISPGLAAGLIVISDRYYYSSVAYQGALGLDPGAILALNQAFAPPPDLVFILTLPISRAIARLSATPGRERQVSEVMVPESVKLRLDGLQVEQMESGAMLFYWKEGQYRSLILSEEGR